ncbi:hypothetical protein ZOSMA_28G00730 [Zostera marina]|uniref:Cullin N-terminal domain-containing protein n=1 Tax=Zostera marina TaxID=29655 RepID=A0A0K9PCC3_ZOSMR|nr:hypothetical protein ZOSMA_28G00730 [Zostera marina]
MPELHPTLIAVPALIVIANCSSGTHRDCSSSRTCSSRWVAVPNGDCSSWRVQFRTVSRRVQFVMGSAEIAFLNASANFYAGESQEFIESCDCGEYLKRAERRLNEEVERASHYLNPSTEKRITKVVEKEMIENHMQRLVHMENSGLVIMLINDKFEDLRRIYNLFCRLPSGLTSIADVMISYLRQEACN